MREAKQIPQATLRRLQYHFHEVIRQRARDLIDKHELELPELRSLLDGDPKKKWFPIPGMHGGFSYWVEGQGTNAKLITESWSRVVEGSGMRHVITTRGIELVDSGFV